MFLKYVIYNSEYCFFFEWVCGVNHNSVLLDCQNGWYLFISAIKICFAVVHAGKMQSIDGSDLWLQQDPK